jgi:hypothetical protein
VAVRHAERRFPLPARNILDSSSRCFWCLRPSPRSLAAWNCLRVLVGGPEPYAAGDYRRFRAQAEAHRAALHKWGFAHAVSGRVKLLQPSIDRSFEVAGPRLAGWLPGAAVLFFASLALVRAAPSPCHCHSPRRMPAPALEPPSASIGHREGALAVRRQGHDGAARDASPHPAFPISSPPPRRSTSTPATAARPPGSPRRRTTCG